ncbi:MAG TPA: transcription antitermination factor NusB, partial [Polyangiaceae bacterium]|nr:transcription antitermination factor NusB [Polyangiaceae bacterium]
MTRSNDDAAKATGDGKQGARARDVAARVVARVIADRAFAAASLDAELGRAKLADPRDAGLATELAYGVLRTYGFLEAIATRLSTRGKVFGEPLARAHLFAGFYTLAFLDRVPAFAAVSESVSGVRRAIGDKPSRFANALLRAYAAELEKKGRPTIEQAVAQSAPVWLKSRLDRALGADEAARYLAAGPVPPPLAVAVRAGEDRDAWALRLAGVVTKVRPGAISPRALLLDGAGDPRALPGVEDALIVQEEGAQAIALSLGDVRGRRVLDACAGRGNKTWLLAHEVGTGGEVVAADKHPQKLETLARRITGAARVIVHAVDW